MDVLKEIRDTRGVWTELMNTPDGAFKYVSAKTRDNGIVTLDTETLFLGHYLTKYTLDPARGWLATYTPLRGQAGSVARVLLNSSSTLQSPHEVIPVHANFTGKIETIELHVIPRSSFSGIALPAGTHFMLDSLLITSPVTGNADWIEAAIREADAHMAQFDAPLQATGPVPEDGAESEGVSH